VIIQKKKKKKKRYSWCDLRLSLQEIIPRASSTRQRLLLPKSIRAKLTREHQNAENAENSENAVKTGLVRGANTSEKEEIDHNFFQIVKFKFKL